MSVMTPRPKELEGVSLEAILDKYVARFKDRKSDWATLRMRKSGVQAAQHRFIGAGGSGKYNDNAAIPAGNFTLSIMCQEVRATRHMIEEVFFVLKGF